MKVIFCKPQLTMHNTDNANLFLEACKEIFDRYIPDINYISNIYQINLLLSNSADRDDILVFFNAESGVYDDSVIKLINQYNNAQSRIWAIAMEKNPECREPPSPITEKQSFDVYSRNENRNPLKNNMRAIAQIFSRKIVAQTLSPLYRDEVLYFISHRRCDGEHITAKLADELTKLTRERNVYRDVVNVAVGDDAQKDIDRNLIISDVLIFLQTPDAHISKYIMKELCYALINNIPVLWVQIDDAPFKKMKIMPGDKPMLQYRSKEFDSELRLEEIANEIEENCFKLIMNSSNQVFSYVDYLRRLNEKNKIKLVDDINSVLAYKVEYKENTRDRYDSGMRKHYIQCFGRNPQNEDIQNLIKKTKETGIYEDNQRIFLLCNHGNREKIIADEKVIEENFDDYIMNLENVSGKEILKKNKRIIISGAFPDCDEIYKASLLEAVLVYSREIIKNGYTLVFGAHPTFQKLIFDIGNIYSSDIKYSIEMHMDKHFLKDYDMNELQRKCTLVLANNIEEMRKQMICNQKSEMLICLGGKIKDNKAQQGVDIEIALAQEAKIPVALVGTVGGRSSEYAYEKLINHSWSDLNNWNDDINEELFHNVNHRLMITKLLDLI